MLLSELESRICNANSRENTGVNLTVMIRCITIKLSSTPFVKVLLAASVVVISDWEEIITASKRDLNRSLISYMFDSTPVFKGNHGRVSLCTFFLHGSICKLLGFSSCPSCSTTELWCARMPDISREITSDEYSTNLTS